MSTLFFHGYFSDKTVYKAKEEEKEEVPAYLNEKFQILVIELSILLFFALDRSFNC